MTGTLFGVHNFEAIARNGLVQIRDERTTPAWHSFGTLLGIPPNVVSVALAGTQGSGLRITVAEVGGGVYFSDCTVEPTPGTGANPAWPNNCTTFTNISPP
ncbi:hypothetical protein [Sinosporangium siamense]|uniref:hypothetical protein n=1 Tax=Sinosporangium siamense TaxID=1367973 RepID=UPI001EF17C10|nr:hypothetical protein [Sinosporangium siamense]